MKQLNEILHIDIWYENYDCYFFHARKFNIDYEKLNNINEEILKDVVALVVAPNQEIDL